MNHRALFTPLITVALAALLLTACRRHDSAPSTSTSSAALPPKIFRLGNGAEPQDIDPQVVNGLVEHQIIVALFESLVAEDPHDLHPIPGQAERWEISADGLVYTFHLRPNLKWSHGAPLTAADFVQSYQRMLSPALASEYSYLLWYVVGAEEYNKGTLLDFSAVGFQAPDERTLIVTLKSPTPFLLKIIASHYAWMPVPIKEIAKHGPLLERRSPWTRPGKMVSNGPFRLKSWSPNEKISVERNPFYWDAATVKLDGIEFFPIEDDGTEERMFRTGQIHQTSIYPSARSTLTVAISRSYYTSNPISASAITSSTSPARRSTTSACAAPWLSPSTAKASSDKYCAATNSPRIRSVTPAPLAIFPAPVSPAVMMMLAACSPKPAFRAAQAFRRRNCSTIPPATTASSPKRSSRCGSKILASTSIS